MELEDLRKEWQHRDAQLSEKLRFHNQLLRSALQNEHLSDIKRLDGMGWFYWLVFIIMVIFLGTFIANHISEPKYWLPAASLQIWTIAMHASQLYLRDGLQKIDFGAPVVIVQQKLETIRQKRLNRFKWGFLSGQILWWIPFCIVVVKALFGIDLYEINDFMPRFMLVNIVVGAVFIPTAVVFTRHISNRFQKAKFLQRVVDNLSGQDMLESMKFLRRLQEFEEPVKVDLG